MKQTARIVSTYAADVSGVCSALFELGGMTVMHDASGCNSTYNTHDEPRWYDHDSLVFISALSELEAVMGDDQKLVRDVCETARELHPRFVALAGTPIPMMTGFDFTGVARLMEQELGIPVLGLPTNGMHSYLSGAGMAFEALADRFARPDAKPAERPTVNVLGSTPLDFSVDGYVEDVCGWLRERGFAVRGSWGMGGNLEDVERAGEATVNLVLSTAGRPAARLLQKRFGTPYVLGAPTLGRSAQRLEQRLHGETVPAWNPPEHADTLLIGEGVLTSALAEDIGGAHVLCPPDSPAPYRTVPDEDALAKLMGGYARVVADPLYRPICRAHFVSLPHEAFSGRVDRGHIPNFLRQSLTI